MNEQYTYSNRDRIAEVIARFRELDDNYNNNLCLYMDSKFWEVFDTRICKTIIRHEYKHIGKLLEDISRLNNAIIRASCVHLRRGKQLSSSESLALKYLSNIFDSEQLKYITHCYET